MAHRDSLIQAISDIAGISTERAERVLKVFVKVRAVTFNAHDGYQIKHGAFMDRAVILRAEAA